MLEGKIAAVGHKWEESHLLIAEHEDSGEAQLLLFLPRTTAEVLQMPFKRSSEVLMDALHNLKTENKARIESTFLIPEAAARRFFSKSTRELERGKFVQYME